MHRLRHRRRVARALAEARSLRKRTAREWRWFRRDLADLKLELAAYAEKVAALKRGEPVALQPPRGPDGHR